MSVTVRLPAPLRSFTAGQRQLELSATTVGALLQQIETTYPGISQRLRDEEGKIRSALHIYVNGENIRFMRNVDTTLTDGDEVSIVPSIAGG